MNRTDRRDDARLREQLVQTHLLPRGIDDPRILDVFRTVPRHRFVDEEQRNEAYEDRPLDIGKGQVITQPSLVAQMTRAARVQPGNRVLEVGTGSGYQAAILAQMCEHVYTVERFEEFARTARDRFRSLGFDHVSFVVADGSRGLPGAGPFDVIVVTAAAESLPDPLAEQLKPGGRLVIPEGPRDHQTVCCYTKEDGGRLRKTRVVGARFVPLIGDHGWDD